MAHMSNKLFCEKQIILISHYTTLKTSPIKAKIKEKKQTCE